MYIYQLIYEQLATQTLWQYNCMYVYACNIEQHIQCVYILLLTIFHAHYIGQIIACCVYKGVIYMLRKAIYIYIRAYEESNSHLNSKVVSEQHLVHAMELMKELRVILLHIELFLCAYIYLERI